MLGDISLTNSKIVNEIDKFNSMGRHILLIDNNGNFTDFQL